MRRRIRSPILSSSSRRRTRWSSRAPFRCPRPRAALALYRAAQAHAAIRGRSYVLPDDVKAQAVAVLRHRLFLNADAQMRGRTTTAIVGEVLARTPVPAEDVAATAG